MISKYDLYDLSAVFVNIRSDVEYELNVQIVDKIIQVLSTGEEATEENQIRKAIAEIQNLDREKWYFVYHNNKYVLLSLVNLTIKKLIPFSLSIFLKCLI